MAYSEITLEEINEKYRMIYHKEKDIFIRLTTFHQKLKSKKAGEFLMQGVGRRLKILTRCINNVFTIFPADQVDHLSTDDLTDVNINLHAFFINITGIFDNLAWVYVFENDLLGKTKDGKISKYEIGLFHKNTQNYLNPELKDYLNSSPIKSWHEDYSKNFRDSLAHRIPLYIPPSLLDETEATEFQKIEDQIWMLDFSKEDDINKYDDLRDKQQNLGRVSHLFSHSISEGTNHVFFHVQILVDYETVEEIINKFCDHF